MLSVAEARAVITTSLSDSDLGDAIEREEAYLARRVGPLDGARTETFIVSDGDEVLNLQRPGTIDTVTDDTGALTDYEARGWSDVVLTAGAWQGSVEVAYTADDADEVKRAAITLVRLALSESGYLTEGAEGYTVTSDYGSRQSMRYAAWRSLLRKAIPQSVRLVSSIPSGGKTVSSVVVTAAGS